MGYRTREGVEHTRTGSEGACLAQKMGEGMQAQVGVLGASSFVGTCLLPLLVRSGWSVHAYARQSFGRENKGVTWRELSKNPPQSEETGLSHWICVAPLVVLPAYFSFLQARGVQRLVVLSSTSVFTKGASSNSEERALAHRLVDAERRLQTWAESQGIQWVILRPTLVYGWGLDKNVTEIGRFIRRFGFFPLLGEAKGLRQPINVEDVAGACLAALQTSDASNRAYNISGGQTLSYREMVACIFSALGMPKPRFLKVPLWAFHAALRVFKRIPRYGKASLAMVERMNQDLVFDHTDAVRDLGFQPRHFQLTAQDLPS